MTDPTVRSTLQAIAAGAPAGDRRYAVAAGTDTAAVLVDAIAQERITGLALLACEQGALTLPPAALDDLHDRHEAQLGLDLRLERLLCAAAEVLDRAGLPYRALKGPVLAHTVYPDPALRSFGDVDVLVPGDAFDDAIAALRALDFHRRFVEPRAGFDARYSKGACLERADGMELDLHRTLAPGAFGLLLARADLFDRPPATFALGNRAITGLDTELAFVHACFHAALGDDPPRLAALRDVVELHGHGVDARAVVALARSVRCSAVIRRAVDLVRDELQVDLPGEPAAWARSVEPSGFDRIALRTYAQEQRSYAAQAAVSFWVMPTLRDRLAYASALAFPARDYVRARNVGYARRASRSLHLVRQWRPR